MKTSPTVTDLPATTTMRAIVQTAYGSPEVFTLADTERPTIAANEVLIKVHAAGMDRGTWHLMSGKPYLLRIMGFGFRRPKNVVPGLDVSGVVAAVGAAVTRFQPGDQVFGVSRGSFAEYAAAREDKLARKPAGLSFAQAAVVPISGLTAIQGLRDAGRISAGQRVLITGASGGVGSFAVQLAKALGAEVTGVCSTAKLDLVKALGADRAIDYTVTDPTSGTDRYDLILDIGGNTPVAKLRRALTPTGTLAIVGGENGGNWTGGFGRSLRAALRSPFVRQRLAMVMAKEHYADLEVLGGMIDAGKLTPSVDRVFPLADAREAMQHLEAGRVRGKIAIAVSDPAALAGPVS